MSLQNEENVVIYPNQKNGTVMLSKTLKPGCNITLGAKNLVKAEERQEGSCHLDSLLALRLGLVS